MKISGSKIFIVKNSSECVFKGGDLVIGLQGKLYKGKEYLVTFNPKSNIMQIMKREHLEEKKGDFK